MNALIAGFDGMSVQNNESVSASTMGNNNAINLLLKILIVYEHPDIYYSKFVTKAFDELNNKRQREGHNTIAFMHRILMHINNKSLNVGLPNDNWKDEFRYKVYVLHVVGNRVDKRKIAHAILYITDRHTGEYAFWDPHGPSGEWVKHIMNNTNHTDPVSYTNGSGPQSQESLYAQWLNQISSTYGNRFEGYTLRGGWCLLWCFTFCYMLTENSDTTTLYKLMKTTHAKFKSTNNIFDLFANTIMQMHAAGLLYNGSQSKAPFKKRDIKRYYLNSKKSKVTKRYIKVYKTPYGKWVYWDFQLKKNVMKKRKVDGTYGYVSLSRKPRKSPSKLY